MKLVLQKEVFWLFDQPRSKYGSGWPSAIYFDLDERVYRAIDVTKQHLVLTYKELPPVGVEFAFETEKPERYSRDHFETTHQAKIQAEYPFPIRPRG